MDNPSVPHGTRHESHGVSINKLNGRNFNTWVFSIECLLTDLDLWDVVTSPIDSEDPDAKRKDAKARAKICLTCEESIYPVIRGAKTAYDTFNSLKKAYADSGLTRRLQLMKKLLSNQYRGNLQSYVHTSLGIQQELQGIGAGVEDEFLAIIILAGLPDEYKPLVMALEHSNARITSENVVAALLKEDSRPCRTTSTRPEDPTALLTKPKKKFCTYCKKLGHLVSDCRNKNKKASAKVYSHNTLEFTLSSCLTHPSSTGSQDWFIDSGASSHMSNRKDWFDSMSSHIIPIQVANKNQILSEGKGTVNINISDNVHKISDVLYVPRLATSLLSVSSLTTKGYDVLFTSKGATITLAGGCQLTGQVIATGSNYKGMYKLDVDKSHALYTPTKESPLLWHRRLGHLNANTMQLLKSKLVGIDFSGKFTEKCVPCLQGKLAKKPFKSSCSKSSKVLQLIHSDLCGPMSTHSWGGALYLLTFTDDFSRKTFGYLLKSKSEVFTKFVEFKHLVENQTGEKIKVLRSDNGREYVNKDMSTFLKENGIIHQTTVPYTPQQNGVSERANRTIIEKARSMLKDSNLPLAYWGEAVNTAIYLKNRLPTQALKNKIPEEVWSGRKINLSHLRVFGCEAHALVPKEKRTKLESKTQTCIFVGYSTETKGYRLIDPQSPRNIIISRDVVFLEDKRLHQPNLQPIDSNVPSPPLPQPEQVFIPMDEEPIVSQRERQPQPGTSVTSDTSTLNTDSDAPVIPEVSSSTEDPDPSPEPAPEVQRRYPTRDRRPPQRYEEQLHMTSDWEPETFKEVLDHPEKGKWLEAMKAEFDSLNKHGTWILVDRPAGRKTTKCKWVYKIKKDTSGNVTKYKARLVAKGFTQVAGVDYGETFSPVARLSSVRLLFAFAAHHGLTVDHLDVETAFLNGDLEEEIYMEQPEGFSTNPKDKVCLLKKALYGLKQAPRQWNAKVCDAMRKLLLKQSANEHCLYYRREGNDLLLVAVFVDDFFVVSTNDRMKNLFKDQLKNTFTVKDLGVCKDCLGMRVHQTAGNIYLDQTKYIENLLNKFGMTDALSVTTPFEPGLKLTVPNKEEDNPELPYQELIGSLMYIAICTRPDIAHAVSYLSQFNAHYGGVHFRAAKRVLRYLKGSKALRLHFHRTAQFCPVGYVDADYGNNLVDRRSFTGFAFLMSGSPISWEARKQRTVALSTTEAEYMALAEACKEAIYLQSLISEIFIIAHPIVIHTDNQSALKLAHNHTFHSRTKHIDIRHHFIRESLSHHNINLLYISTHDMIADIFTKPLPKLKHNKCTVGLGLCIV